MKIEDIRMRLKSLRVYTSGETIDAGEADRLAKEAAVHFGLPEKLVSVVLVRGSRNCTMNFKYRSVTVVSYQMFTGTEMQIGWVEKCILRLIGEVLISRNPNLNSDTIRKMFNQ